MDRQDGVKFKEELKSILELYSNKPVDISVSSMRRWWSALKAFSLDDVIVAFDLHAKRDRFSPKPVDIINILSSGDGRPEPEEAWALAMRVTDEDDTVVWTQEMAGAWAIAQPIMDAGDKIGARMAFRQHYERLLRTSREAHQPAKWNISLGHDSLKRNDAVKKAQEQGLISRDIADNFLVEAMTEEGQEIAAMLGYSGDKVVDHPSKSEAHRKNVTRMRKALNEGSALFEANKERQAQEKEKMEGDRRELLVSQAGLNK